MRNPTVLATIALGLSCLHFSIFEKSFAVESFEIRSFSANTLSYTTSYASFKRVHSANRDASTIKNVFGVAVSSVFQRRQKGIFSAKDDSSKERNEKDRKMLQIITLLRIGLPSLLAGVMASVAFPFLALGLATIMNDAGVFAVLSQDSSQFVQNFLTVSGLLFSILVGQTYYFMYIQQEAVYYSLFNEVTEAKSLLEQVALVCQGRR